MRRLRTLSTRRLTAIVVAVAALAVTAGIAQAQLGSDPEPQPKALDRAITDALNAPAPQGVSARIAFTNALLPSGSMPHGEAGPLLSGAEGRIWIARDGRMRLELQSDHGDAQIVSDGETLSVYDGTSDTVYRMALPEDREAREEHEPAALADVRRGLERVARAWTLSGAKPTSTGGRPTYTVRIAPKDDGGLLGAGELAWDAEHGVPLRGAIYAQGQAEPVLEIEATEVAFGRVADGDLRFTAPRGAKLVEVDPPAHDEAPAKAEHGQPDVTGVDAVQRRLDFELSAPRELAGLPRKQVRLVRFDGAAGALSVYGEGLGGILVLQREAAPSPEREGEMQLPQVNIDGATGTEIATALGTVLTFERGGVEYTVLGSVPPVAAENAARDLR